MQPSSTGHGSLRTLAPVAIAATFLCFIDIGCRRELLRGPNYGPTSEAHVYAAHVPAQRVDEPVYRLILAGDAGAVRSDSPVLPLLRKWGDADPDRTTVLYLGDNIYPAGLQANGAEGKATLRRLLGATEAFKLFLPGNHDWGYRRQQRRTEIVGNQQAFIEQHGKHADFRPKDGCPGPDVVTLLERNDGLKGGLSVVVLDLHWWLLPAKRRPTCRGIDDTDAFIERLQKVLEERRDDNVIIAAHHPLKTAGPHGGHSRGFWHDLAVPILYRFYTIQDVLEPNYVEMVAVLSGALAEHPPLAVVAGHDHNLQVMDGGDTSRLAIVSGSFSRLTSVTAIEDTLFAHAHLGFVVMDFYAPEADSDAVVVRVIESQRRQEQVFAAAYDLQEEPQTQTAEQSDTLSGLGPR
jgi:hypothetical protein